MNKLPQFRRISEYEFFPNEATAYRIQIRHPFPEMGDHETSIFITRTVPGVHQELFLDPQAMNCIIELWQRYNEKQADPK